MKKQLQILSIFAAVVLLVFTFVAAAYSQHEHGKAREGKKGMLGSMDKMVGQCQKMMKHMDMMMKECPGSIDLISLWGPYQQEN